MSADQIVWWDSLPRVVVIAAAALLTNTRGEWLMLHSTYREGWQLPGGIVEAGESPADGCVREVAEEVGLEIEVGPLLSVDYRPQHPGTEGPPPMLHFTFSGPRYDELPDLLLQATEIREARWMAPDEACRVAIPHMAMRLAAVHDSADRGLYLEDSVRRGRSG